MPLLATLGGIVGPALLFLVGALVVGQYSTLGRGWAVPCATDIAFSYLVGRLIFGVGHPAIAFLLLLAIADDAAGLVIIAVAYPQQAPELFWLLLSVAGMAIAWTMTRLKIHSFWWYLLIPGTLSWFGFYWAHIHPALGLVPIIPFMPHAGTDLGIFVREELKRHDTLNEFEHWWKNPVEIILGLFGLCNAGVAFSSVGTGTWLVLIGLIIGKPLGITLCTWLGDRVFKLSVPDGMDYRDVITLGFVAGIGFTVALFVATAAFNSTDPNLDPIKMGALFSFAAAIVSFIVAKMLGVKPWNRKQKSSIEPPD
jgi:NhaA family Na+:H+ antiporter